MSEFIHKAEIARLSQANAKLNKEIESLQNEIQQLNRELENFREIPPDEIKHLKEKITETEQREADYKERIERISREAERTKNTDRLVEQFFSTLQLMNAAPVAVAIEQSYKHKQRAKTVVAFLLGVLVALAAWLITVLMLNDGAASAIYNRFLENVSTFIRR
jgi:chromosome segregation ATPase